MEDGSRNSLVDKIQWQNFVVVHPDDEVLGAGASIWKWAHNGDHVDVCIMCTEAKARAFRPDDKELDDDTHAALKYIGVNKEYEGTFPNIEMNTVPHLQLVQFIESAIKESVPDIIITHHPADTNNDHLQPGGWYNTIRQGSRFRT